MHTVSEIFHCVCLRWSTEDEVNHSFRQGTGISEQDVLGVEKRSRMERPDPLQDRVTMMTVNHTIK